MDYDTYNYFIDMLPSGEFRRHGIYYLNCLNNKDNKIQTKSNIYKDLVA